MQDEDSVHRELQTCVNSWSRTIEFPERTRFHKVNCCLKVHKTHSIILSAISGLVGNINHVLDKVYSW